MAREKTDLHHSDRDSYENLAIAVYRRAVLDYERLYKKKHMSLDDYYKMRNLRRWLISSPFGAFLARDPEQFVEYLERKFDEEMKPQRGGKKKRNG